MAESPLDEPHEPEAIPPDFPAESTLPRLRLHHFFALTAVMAVLLAIGGPQRNFGDARFQPPQFLLTLMIVLGVVHQIVAAVAVTALAYGIAAYRRGELFFNQPGHWILVEITLVALFTIPTILVYRSMNIDSQVALGDTQFKLMIISGIYSVLFIVFGRMAVNIYLGITKCRQQRWKSVFFGKAAASVIFGLGEIVVIVLLLSAMRTDRREQLLRNAGHRCGTYAQLAQSSLTIISVSFGILNAFLVFAR